MLGQALAAYEPRQPDKAVPALLQAHAAISKLQGNWVTIKKRQIEDALQECLGLYMDASSERFAARPWRVAGPEAFCR